MSEVGNRSSAEHCEAPGLLPKPGRTCCCAIVLQLLRIIPSPWDRSDSFGLYPVTQPQMCVFFRNTCPVPALVQPSRSCLCCFWPLTPSLRRFGVAGVLPGVNSTSGSFYYSREDELLTPLPWVGPWLVLCLGQAAFRIPHLTRL